MRWVDNPSKGRLPQQMVSNYLGNDERASETQACAQNSAVKGREKI